MLPKKFGIVLVAVCLLSTIAAAADKTLTSNRVIGARYPALSPDGRRVAFTLYGDLWIVPTKGGQATRLTLHPADDVKPRWSPDGRWIAFTSNRDGNFDVWLIPATGGRPRKITQHGGWDSVADWTADGRWIIFYTLRTGELQLWRIPVKGGSPVPLTLDGGRDGCLSPDNKQLVYTRGAISLYIKGYQGSSNWDIYTMPYPAGLPQRLTDYQGNDIYPYYSADGKQVYYLSEHNSIYNIWRVGAQGGKPVQITKFKHSIEYLHFCARQQAFVLVMDFRLWYMSLDGKISPIPIQIASDIKQEQQQQRVLTSNAGAPSWSPDGRQIVFCLQGDIWIMSASGGQARRLTNTDEQEDWPRFSPNGKYIAYFSDKNGNKDIFIMPAQGGKPVQLTHHPKDDFYHSWSPDSKWLVFTSERAGNRDIWIISSQDGSARQLTSSSTSQDDAVFSPDGRWIAFDSGRSGYQEIWVMPSNGTEADAFQITHRKAMSQVPTWSPDGSMIAFESNDSQWRPSLWVTSPRGGEPMPLAMDLRTPVWSPDGKYILAEGEKDDVKTLHKIEAPARLRSRMPIPFSAEVTVDLVKERRRIFLEAWQAIKTGFYDPKFHGVDWNRIRSKYMPLALQAQTNLEFNGVISRMIGELKSSHLGIWGPKIKNKVHTAELGATLVLAPDGRSLIFKRIVPDGPVDKAWIREGDHLLAIGKHRLPKANLYRYLAGRVGQEVVLIVSPGKDESKARRVRLKPITGEELDKLRYRAWYIKRRELVERKSGGRAFYVHLSDMDQANLNRFKAYVKKYMHTSKGMVLDVRNNGGGNIHRELMDILIRRPFAWTIERRQKKGDKHWQPAFYWDKPVVLLINENSFSDAEVFPHCFKSLKRGKVVGYPTAGGVIGTKTIKLSNGASFRVPWVGYYTVGGTNLEGMGVQPDIVVPETAEDRLKGRDPQLEKAVAVLLEELKAYQAPASPRKLKPRAKKKAK